MQSRLRLPPQGWRPDQSPQLPQAVSPSVEPALVGRRTSGADSGAEVDGEQSRSFKQKAGLRQGCVMSLLLLNIFIGKIMRIVIEIFPAVTVGDTMMT